MGQIEHRKRGPLTLASIVIGMAILWLGVFPRLAETDWVQMRVTRLREAGIDNNAVFYSDHPAMRDIERRVNNIVRGKDPAFWRWPSYRANRD